MLRFIVNTKLAVAAHVLTLLAHEKRELTSEYIASSVNTNPVVIRRALAKLREAKLVRSKSGPGGGWELARAADAVTLRDVLRIVDPGLPFAVHDAPNPRCAVGRHIAGALESTFDKAEQALEGELDRVTIADLLRFTIRNYRGYESSKGHRSNT